MIQRVQSVFFLVAFLVSVALFFIPISQKPVFNAESGDAMYVLYANGFHVEGTIVKTSLPILALTLITGLCSLILIFLYKNRPLQIKLGMLTMLFSLTLLICGFWIADSIGLPEQKSSYLAGTYLFFVQLYALLRGVKGVRKDEALIKSADRIR